MPPIPTCRGAIQPNYLEYLKTRVSDKLGTMMYTPRNLTNSGDNIKGARQLIGVAALFTEGAFFRDAVLV